MGLFEKKNCAVCNKETGLFGTVKLEDGTICKECSGKLSPFFTGRKKTTVAEIKAQLAYREKNMAAVRNFNPDVIIGNGTKVYVDSSTGTFAVSNHSDWRKYNPDLITQKMLKTCDISVKEHKDEIYDKDENGESVSFDPPRYEFTYEFDVIMGVDSPYFDRITFELSDPNRRPEGSDSIEYYDMKRMARKLQAAVMPDRFSDSDGDIEITFSTDTEVTSSGEKWKCSCGHYNTGGKFCAKCGKPRATKWFCPACGTENYENFCVSCGHKKPL